jgi:hypothetical protein
VEQKATKHSKSESEVASSFEELAARQGVQPATDFEALLGSRSVEDESVEEFAAMLRKWRGEGAFFEHTR